MSESRLVVDISDLPEVEVVNDGSIIVGGWTFDYRDMLPTREDVLAFATAVRWFEEHPEVVPDVE